MNIANGVGHLNTVMSFVSKEARINGCAVVAELHVIDDRVQGISVLPYGLFVDGKPFNMDGACQKFKYVYGRGETPNGVLPGRIYAPAHTVPTQFPKR